VDNQGVELRCVSRPNRLSGRWDLGMTPFTTEGVTKAFIKQAVTLAAVRARANQSSGIEFNGLFSGAHPS
jgi:hypothetical protein